MPWTVENPPDVARNWTRSERERCVAAANAVLERGGSEEEAIFACIRAAGKGAQPMDIKRIRAPLTLKQDGEEGTVQAVFSTFNVIDKDGDIVLPSAITHGQQVPMTWHHDWATPVGKGTIRVEEDRAVFDGRFFLDTQAGQEAYKTVKAMGELQQWSWGFRIVDASFEQRDGEFVRIIKRAEVYEVSPVLVGAGENTHTLAIKGTQPYADHAETVLATVKAFVERSRSLADLRAKEGRVLSDANRRRLAALRETLGQIADELDALLAETEPKRDDDGKAVGQQLYLAFQKLNTRLVTAGIGGN